MSQYSKRNQLPQYAELDATDVNHTFFAKICANYFIHLLASKRYPFPAPCSAWQAEFPVFVHSILQRSGLDVSVAIAAMTLLHRYKAVYTTAVAYNDEAPRLFLEAYINAAKAMGCPRPMSFWQRVSGGRYSLEQLLEMKAQFQKDLLGFINIQPTTFDRFKAHLEAYYSPTDDARAFTSATVGRSVRWSDPIPAYNLTSIVQPPSCMKYGKLGVNTSRTRGVLEPHQCLPCSRR